MKTSTAGKLEIVMSLYNQGLLCKCETYEESKFPGDDELNLIHEIDCKAKDIVLNLLNFSEG
jgi:hypothetical protein